MRAYIELGPVPSCESCQQVGTEGYNHSIARAECSAYKRQLQRMFPKGEFAVKSFPHDFGNYLEVVAYLGHAFHGQEDEVTLAAFDAEENTPENWDEEALIEIATLTA